MPHNNKNARSDCLGMDDNNRNARSDPLKMGNNGRGYPLSSFGEALMMEMLTPESIRGQYSASTHLINKRRRGGYDNPQKPSNKDLFIFSYHGEWKPTEEIIEDADAEASANLCLLC